MRGTFIGRNSDNKFFMADVDFLRTVIMKTMKQYFSREKYLIP